MRLASRVLPWEFWLRNLWRAGGRTISGGRGMALHPLARRPAGRTRGTHARPLFHRWARVGRKDPRTPRPGSLALVPARGQKTGQTRAGPRTENGTDSCRPEDRKRDRLVPEDRKRDRLVPARGQKTGQTENGSRQKTRQKT